MSDIDLDQQPSEAARTRLLDMPSRTVGAVAGAGLVLIAATALVAPKLARGGEPVVTTAAPAVVCAPAPAPLPAFTIDLPVAGDLLVYEDSGSWSWRQAVLIPAHFGATPGAPLVELQFDQGPSERIALVTGSPDQLVLRALTAEENVVWERPIAFGGYGRWASVSISAEDGPEADTIQITVGTAAESISAVGLYAPLAGFSLAAPSGPSDDSTVRYGAPSFTTEGC